MEDFKVGATFSSWVSFFEAFEEYKKSTFQPLIKFSNRLTSFANQRMKSGAALYPAHHKYTCYDFRCTHRGAFKPRGGQKEMGSFKSGCNAKVYAAVDKTTKKIVLQTLLAEHNHEISQALYAHYPKQRLLSKEEEEEVGGLCNLKVSNKVIKRHVNAEFGKNLSLSDIRNLKSRTRAKAKIVDGTTQNDAQLLLRLVEEEKTKDPGAFIDLSVNEDAVLKYLYFQKSDMQKTFDCYPEHVMVYFQKSDMQKTFDCYPEHVMVDCTYCVNDRQMPLITFICVDGNMESRVVAFAIISDESKDMLTTIFQLFQKANPCTDRTSTFMVDKDLNEISCLQTVFPHAVIELCLFHVLKAFKSKISQIGCAKKVKDELREYCQKVCYARSETEYDEWREKLIECDSEFGRYFMDNWHGMRDRWVQFSRSQHLNFGNRTNNRIESYHQKLKSEVPRNAPLDVMFNNIILVIATLQGEVSKRHFLSTMKKIPSLYPELQKSLTLFAFSHSMAELERALTLKCMVGEECVTVLDDCEHFVRDGVCDCRVFVANCLPCRHVIVSRIARGLVPIEIGMFHSRWHLSHSQRPSQMTSKPVGVSVVASQFCNARPLSKVKKFSLAKTVALQVADKLSELGTDLFQYYYEKLIDFDTRVGELRRIVEEEDEEYGFDQATIDRFEEIATSGSGDDARFRWDRSPERAEETITDAGSTHGEDGLCVMGVDGTEDVESVEEAGEVQSIEGAWEIQSVELAQEVQTNTDEALGVQSVFEVDESQNEQVVSEFQHVLEGQEVHSVEEAGEIQSVGQDLLQELIAVVKPPVGLGKRGRPKGSGLTALGGERKGRKRKGLRLKRGSFKRSSFACPSSAPADDEGYSNLRHLGCREDFFSNIYEELSMCDSIEDVKNLASRSDSALKKFPLPEVTVKSISEVAGIKDSVASNLMAGGCAFSEGERVPVETNSDGNCVPRALSLAVFGTDEFHLEIRCRIVLELAQHDNEYVTSLDRESTKILCESSHHYVDGSVRETFIQELLGVKSMGTFMGLWQLMAAANVFGAPVQSVYPQKGPICYRNLFNTVLEPRRMRSSHMIALMWSSTRELPDSYWVANHVVPLLSVSDNVEVEAE